VVLLALPYLEYLQKTRDKVVSKGGDPSKFDTRINDLVSKSTPEQLKDPYYYPSAKLLSTKPILQTVDSVKPIQQTVDSVKPILQTVDSVKPIQQTVDSVKPIQQTVDSVKPIQQTVDSVKPIQQTVDSTRSLKKANEFTGIARDEMKYKPKYTEQIENTLADVRGAQFESQYETRIGDILNQINESKFQYDPISDSALQQAQAQAQQSAMEAMNRRGILNSTVTADRVGQVTASLVPEYEAIAYDRYQDNLSNMFKQADFLNSLDEQDYRRFVDDLELKLKDVNILAQLDDRTLKATQQNLDTLFKVVDRVTKEKQQEIDNMNNDITNAWERVAELGYVDNSASLILGLPIGTPSKEARERIEALEDEMFLKEQELAYEIQLDESKKKTARLNLEYAESLKRETKQQETEAKAQQQVIENERDAVYGNILSQIAGLTVDEAVTLIQQDADRIAEMIGGERLVKLYDVLRDKQKEEQRIKESEADAQLQREKFRETARSNKARETETARSNKARETETARSNKAKEEKKEEVTTKSFEDYLTFINNNIVDKGDLADPEKNKQAVTNYLETLFSQGVDNNIIDQLARQFGL